MDANNDLFQVVFLIDERLWTKSMLDNSGVTLNHLVRNCVLKILTSFGAPKPLRCDKNVTSANPRLEWGVKFFSSSKTSKTLRDKPVFREFHVKNLEEFEKELEKRLDTLSSLSCDTAVTAKHCSVANEEAVDCDVFDAVKIALRTVIYDFPWDKPDITSPVKSVRFMKTGKKFEAFPKKSDLTDQQEVDNSRQNFIFVICSCPQYLESCDVISSSASIEVLKAFLPPDVRRQLVDNFGVRLFWINIGSDYWKMDVLSNHLNGPQVLDKALQTVGGRLIPSSVLANPGTLHSTYVGILFCCNAKDCCSRYNDKVANLAHGDVEEVMAELPVGMPAVPVFPLSSVMEYYTNTPASCKPVQHATVMLHLTSDLNIGPSISFSLRIHRVFTDTSSTLLEKIVCNQMAGCPCCSYTERVCPVSRKGICMVPLATASTESLQASCFYSDETHLVAACQQTEEMVGKSEKHLPKWSTDGESLHTGSYQFEDLLLLLTKSSRVLLLKSVGHSQSCQAVLQPLSLTTATLSFLTNAYDEDQLAVNEIVNELMLMPSNAYTDFDPAMPRFAQIEHLSSDTGHCLSRGFNPSFLEPWYIPEGATEAADSLISNLTTNARSLKASNEKQLLKQLQMLYGWCDGFTNSNSVGFHSPRSKRYLARQLRENRLPSERTSSQEIKPYGDAEQLANLLTREPVRKVGAVVKTPVKKGKSVSNTPLKKTKHTPRRTPGKKSNRTPKKSSRLTPGKARRPVTRRTPAKSSGALWRANLIMQKSREAMMAKKTCSVKNDESAQVKSVDLTAVNEQFTTTGWQDISSEEALILQLRITYDRVIEGEGTPLLGAKSMVTSSIHFYRNSGQADIPKSTCTMLCEHFLLKLPGLHAKYKGHEDISSKASKLTEYQLQVLLRMEIESECGSHCDFDGQSNTFGDYYEEIVRMLQAMSFIKDPGFLSAYLRDTLFANYAHSASRLLYKIYSELMLPIPVELEHLRTPEEANSADQSVPMPSINPSSSNFVLSNGIRSGETQANAGRPRKLYRSVTFTQPSQRQIQVPVKKSEVPTPARRSTRIASTTKTMSNQPADVSETKKVRRMLFDGSEADRRLSLPPASFRALGDSAVSIIRRTSDDHRTPKKSYPGLKMKVVSETPAHKQGNRLQMKLELRQKRLSIDPSSTAVIAESPVKYTDDRGSRCQMVASIEPSQLMKRDSFYSGGHTQNTSKYTRLEQRMTQRVCSPPAETVSSNYVVGSWLTSPRRITPKALFGALLSPSPDKSGSQELRVPVLDPFAAGTPRRLTPRRLPGISPTDLLSPSRNTRLQARLVHSKMDLDEVVLSPKIQRPNTISSALSNDSPSIIPNTEGKRLNLNQSMNQNDVRQSKIFSGSRKRIAPIQLSRPTPVPLSTSVDGSTDELVTDGAGTSCADLKREGCSYLSTVATPVSNDKRQIKTPDSLDKWPRKKNRVLIDRSPTHTSSTCRFLSTSDVKEVTETVSLDLHPMAKSISLTVAVDKLSESSSHASNDTGLSKKPVTSAKYKNLFKRSTSTLKRALPDGVNDVSNSAICSPHHKALTNANFDTFSGTKYFNLFGMDTDDTSGAEQNALGSRETKANLKNENTVPSICNNHDSKRMLRSNSRSETLATRSGWSSGFSSGSLMSFSERSSSPVFPACAMKSNLDDVVSQAVGSYSEVSLSGQSSPVFDRKLLNDVVLKNSTEPGSEGKAERIFLPEGGKSFSPNITNQSLMHLITSPLLDVTIGKFKKADSNKSSSTRRCLEHQLGSSATK